MAKTDTNFYLAALKSGGLKDVKLITSNRKDVKDRQDNKCAKCHKELRPFMYKFVDNPVTKQKEIICSDCAIPIIRKH